MSPFLESIETSLILESINHTNFILYLSLLYSNVFNNNNAKLLLELLPPTKSSF
jgi:hypothetical protein